MATSHGTEWLETGKDEIVAELNVLLASMPGAGINPLYSFVYERHNVAKLELNAVTIDFEGMDGESGEPVAANNKAIRWLPIYSIRVHTARINGIQDGQKQMRLLNSIAEKLHLNHKLADTGFHVQMIDDLTVREEFTESYTNGGHLHVMVSKDVEYIQE